jgi:hypothetical protein
LVRVRATFVHRAGLKLHHGFIEPELHWWQSFVRKKKIEKKKIEKNNEKK